MNDFMIIGPFWLVCEVALNTMKWCSLTPHLHRAFFSRDSAGELWESLEMPTSLSLHTACCVKYLHPEPGGPGIIAAAIPKVSTVLFQSNLHVEFYKINQSNGLNSFITSLTNSGVCFRSVGSGNITMGWDVQILRKEVQNLVELHGSHGYISRTHNCLVMFSEARLDTIGENGWIWLNLKVDYFQPTIFYVMKRRCNLKYKTPWLHSVGPRVTWA